MINFCHYFQRPIFVKQTFPWWQMPRKNYGAGWTLETHIGCHWLPSPQGGLDSFQRNKSRDPTDSELLWVAISQNELSNPSFLYLFYRPVQENNPYITIRVRTARKIVDPWFETLWSATLLQKSVKGCFFNGNGHNFLFTKRNWICRCLQWLKNKFMQVKVRVVKSKVLEKIEKHESNGSSAMVVTIFSARQGTYSKIA